VLDRLANGITVDNVSYGPISATLERQVNANAWVLLALREGKNREVRRVMEHLGYPVNRLIRTSFGPFQLGKLPRGAVEEVPDRVLASHLPRDRKADAAADQR
jgi:23S rRNA pseudouridine2605 synthase